MPSSTSNSERQYLQWFAVFTAPLFFLLCLNFLFLRNAGELMTIPDILARQQDPKTFCLYGTALYGDTYRYKLDALMLRRPEVIAIGSSRMLTLRERFFSQSFYNLSNTVSNLHEGRDVVEGILAQAVKPTTVIFGIDFWWFNGAYIPPTPYSHRPEPLHQFEGYFLFKPFAWLREEKITPKDYIRTIIGKASPDFCSIGIQALKRRTGFAPDGSQYPFIDPDLQPGSVDQPFREIDQIRAGVDRYTYADRADPRHLEEFFGLIDQLRSAGIDVIVLLPPFTQPIADALTEEKGHFGILEDIRKELRKKDVFFFDATDPKTIGSSDCEFQDGVHPGDVAMARVLLAIDQTRRRDGQPPLSDTAGLQATVVRYAGRAMIPDPRVTTVREGDFLHIGCLK